MVFEQTTNLSSNHKQLEKIMFVCLFSSLGGNRTQGEHPERKNQENSLIHIQFFRVLEIMQFIYSFCK